MNSEELELSLRTEFESHLKGVLAGLKQDVADFQKNFEAEFQKHKAQLDQAVNDLSARMTLQPEYDRAFSGSVAEHLRLARDEGAQLAANAFGEAEKLKEETAQPASYDLIRDAIKDISSKTSQSAILKSLVEHAANFTPRGAFFIVKNDHFVGWKVFGKEGRTDEKTVRDLHFPLAADTILAASIMSMATKDGTFGAHADDNAFLDMFEFGKPDRMYAVPLTARGRGVAALYADYGTEGVNLNVEALETLVRVAGLTVELLAASQSTAKADPKVEESHPVQSRPFPVAETQFTAPAKLPVEHVYAVEPLPVETYTPQAERFPVAEEEYPAVEEAVTEQPPALEEYAGVVSFEEEQPAVTHAVEAESPQPEQPAQFESAGYDTSNYETADFGTIETTDYQAAEQAVEQTATDYSFTSGDSYGASEPAVVETVNDYSMRQEDSGVSTNGKNAEYAPEPVVEVATAQPSRSRFSERNVDLPIDVADDERRLHNDARRFARLLVSEIKLYNEQKVNEGREANDLYDRLREAIDRSRDMYDKRVQPTVASKFDYFHYELVSSLAEGSDLKLGSSYPGATV